MINSSMGDSNSDDGELLKSAYQVAREANIRANLEELRALGLLGDEDLENLGTQKGERKGDNNKNVKRKREKAKVQPSRSSRRLQHLTPEGGPLSACSSRALDCESGDDSEAEESRAEEIFRITMERKIARLRALHEAKQTGYNNPTATYEHTWKRVKTMSDKALARRVSVIEKAVGQHCIVKMRMFAEVLILAGKEELAELASESLSRLKALIAQKGIACPESDTA